MKFKKLFNSNINVFLKFLSLQVITFAFSIYFRNNQWLFEKNKMIEYQLLFRNTLESIFLFHDKNTCLTCSDDEKSPRYRFLVFISILFCAGYVTNLYLEVFYWYIIKYTTQQHKVWFIPMQAHSIFENRLLVAGYIVDIIYQKETKKKYKLGRLVDQSNFNLLPQRCTTVSKNLIFLLKERNSKISNKTGRKIMLLNNLL